MKTKRTLVSILAIFAVTIAMAIERPKMNVQALNPNQVLVTIENKNATNMEMSIFDKDDNIVYYKKSSNPIQAFNKIFDVKNLKNGNYTLEIASNGITFNHAIKIDSKQIKIGDKEELATPYFSNNSQRLTISYLNFENKDYQLAIYNKDGLVYKTIVGKQSPLQSGFDLSQLEEGNYTAVLNSGKNEYNYQFTK